MRKPDWDIDRARGEEAEQLVRRMRTALAVGSCEVKRDDLAETKAVNWVFVLYDMRVIVWMPVWLLRNIAKVGKVAECRVGSHPTRGVVIPVDRLLTEARLAVPFDERQAA